jgi:elongation factor Ts
VARNALFQGLASRVALAALAALPRSLDTTSAQSNAAGALALAEALGGAALPAAAAGAAPCSVAQGLAGVIAQVRENMVLRRAAALGGEGCVVVPYAHNSPAAGLGTIGVLVALRRRAAGGGALERSPALLALGRRLAMHIAAAAPQYTSRAAVPPEALERERAVLLAASKDLAAKPPAMAAKILEGKLGKFYGDCVLLEQAFALGEDGGKVGKWVDEEGKRAGVAGGLDVAGFAVFRVGAGGGSGNAPAPA